jgi:hypothetical protein
LRVAHDAALASESCRPETARDETCVGARLRRVEHEEASRFRYQRTDHRCSVDAAAPYNATIIGAVDFVQQIGPSVGYTAETITFRLDNQPTSHAVPDAQTLTNMLAILLTAKASGAQLQVAYDNTGGFCDHGMVGVYYLVLR